ncbi:MAG TPA: YdiU family protein [Kofleriaceae bacterium]|jgi:uncharacterized protein YdiU (UPF0061 family)
MFIRNDFIAALPGDPVRDNRSRQVFHACYSRITPTPVAKPELLIVVPEVAALLGGELDVDVLAGNRIVDGMTPYAACYGGHQFGTWAGQLGDGRAITLGEIAHDGETWEVQLKGAGPTPYSRRSDGRAVLRSSLRELVCSEAMFHLGIPTTRALSLALTGETVVRDLRYDGHPRAEPGAVVCRVAPSFLRFGSFEIHASRDDLDTLRTLADFTRARFFAGADLAAMFAEVAARTAWLVAEWLRVGFVHGVMNTDNMSILGLTIDYGPYGWLEPFELDWTPNLTDASGRRYRYGNQAAVAHWNVGQLAKSLALIATPDELARMQATVARFPAELGAHVRANTLRKLGLAGRRDTAATDDALLAELGSLLAELAPDFTLFFRLLARAKTPLDLRDAFYEPPTALDEARLRTFLAELHARDPDPETADAVNPAIVARNWVVQQVIEATEAGDRTELPALLDVLRRPYTAQATRFDGKRPPEGMGALSCSS